MIVIKHIIQDIIVILNVVHAQDLGQVYSANSVTCSWCGGTGIHPDDMDQTKPCPGCGGDGKEGSYTTCSSCSGSGTISTYHSGYWSGGYEYTNFGTLTIDSSTNADGTITLTANTPNVTITGYSWSGAGSGNTNSITVSGPGTYTLTVSMSSGSYTGSGSVSATIIED